MNNNVLSLVLILTVFVGMPRFPCLRVHHLSRTLTGVELDPSKQEVQYRPRHKMHLGTVDKGQAMCFMSETEQDG